ncbi:MAG: vWA domain-containing protein [Bacteroidia bacterium]|nr:VWA domain-containing protein [Bacteroidia bacterium]MDW8158377.1 vWA domain-containing protein [Bacteroidia bacterium]
MPYSAEISRNNPSCFLFVIDQSGSMDEKYPTINKSKAEALADVINRVLQQLVIKCSKSEGIRDYYHVGVIGYGAQGVKPAFSGALSEKELVPISEIANNPARIEQRTKRVPDGAGGLVEMSVKFPIWFEPVSYGGTPMKAAFRLANSIIDSWLHAHPHCFPPIVIHITDGESTDGDPTEEMQKLTSKASSDGNVLLFNLHTSTRSSNLTQISFPSSEANLPDNFAKMLYNGASFLPPFMQKVASQEFDLNLGENAKAFVLNGDIDIIITAIEIGTRPSIELR